jgi:hypothetical protein
MYQFGGYVIPFHTGYTFDVLGYTFDVLGYTFALLGYTFVLLRSLLVSDKILIILFYHHL